MAGGQQINSGQGSLEASGSSASEAVSGSESTAAAGTTAPARLVGLRSRKAVGGSASRAIAGSQASVLGGSLAEEFSFVATGQAVGIELGSLGRARSKALTGQVVTSGAGLLLNAGNQPPVWQTVPTITFYQGQGAQTADVSAYVSDPNGDTLTLTKNAVALPAGVTFNATLNRYEYDGTSPIAGTDGHVISADDGYNEAPISVNSGSMTALSFPGDQGVNRSFRRTRAQGLPDPYPLTIIFRSRVRNKSPEFYQTIFFYGHTPFFSNTTRYYGGCPYPSPSPNGPIRWEIAVDGGDTVGDLIENDRWYTGAFVAYRDGSGTHHRFYYDLPNTSKLISEDQNASYFSSIDPSAELCFGDAPWDHVRSGSNSKEQLKGELRGIKVISAQLTLAELLEETASDELVTTKAQSNIWYYNPNPTADDLTDKSGNGNDFTWYDNNNKATTWTGGVTQGILWDGISGVTRDYWNLHLRLRWENTNGDWTDSAGTAQGSVPYATVTSGSGSGVQHSFTGSGMVSLVNDWLAYGNTGALLRTTGGGQVNYRARQTANPPTLSITTNTGTFNCTCTSDAHMQTSDGNALGSQTTFRVASNLYNSVLYFDISAVTGTVSSATMTLTTDAQFTPASVIQVMRTRPPTVWIGDGASPTLGLASQVVLDANITSVPGVLYRKRFISGWNSDMVQYGPPQTSDPSPTVFTGSSNPVAVDNSTGRNHEYMRGQYNIDSAQNNSGSFSTSMNGNLRFADTPYGMGLSEPDEAYVRWYLMIEDNWDTTIDVSKMPGLHSWVSNPFDSGDPATGANGWSARGHIGTKPTDANPYVDLRWCGNYVYHMDQAGGFGDSAYNWDPDGTQYRWGNFCLQKQRWYCIEQRVKMNTPGLEDGVLEQWVDGVKVFSKTNLRWRNTTALKIQQIWFTWYHGGMNGPDVTMNWRMSDLVIASSYIGPKRKV